MDSPKTRLLVTGAAGFIGSNLVEQLLRRGHEVVGLDNFSTGRRRNLEEVGRLVGTDAAKRFSFVEGDVQNPDICCKLAEDVKVVRRYAALGSVPRSIADPVPSFQSNVAGCVSLLDAARRARVRRFVYASSSAVYGDHPDLPKREDRIGKPLSPYAATKLADEIFAEVFSRCYGLQCVGLRYFNVFGPRQDPDGAYAAVIPRWIASLVSGEPVWINGDGSTSRDFCFVENVVQANLMAATADSLLAPHSVFNVAVGQQTTLLQLFEVIRETLLARGACRGDSTPRFRDFREGDVKHSLADIGRIEAALGYAPTHSLVDGIGPTVDWHLRT